DLVPQAPVDDVAIPAHAEGVEVEGEEIRSELRALQLGARGWIEGDPARAVEVGLDPGVRVLEAHHEVASVGIPLSSLKTGDHSRGNAQAAQHHGQRGSAVPAGAAAGTSRAPSRRCTGGGRRAWAR